MNLTVNGINPKARFLKTGKNTKRNTTLNKLNYNTSFQGYCTNKALRNTGYGLMAAALISLAACFNSKAKKDVSDNEIPIETNTEIIDSSSIKTEGNKNGDDNVKTYYHYSVTDQELTSDNYDWVETRYPDGTVVKDSMEYKITETPNGEKTISKTIKNKKGETVIYTSYPDSTKGVRIEKGANYKDTIFWQNGNVKQIKIKDVTIEHGKSPSNDKELINNQTYKVYNKDGILLYWEVIDNSIKADEENFKYDEKGRLIDNGFTKYEYEGNSEIPIRLTEELEGCKYITEFDEFGTANKKYFEASNGIITPYAQIYEINW